MPHLTRASTLPLIRAALREDAAGRDITSRAVLPANTRIKARVVAKAPGVLAGVKLAALVFTTLDPALRCAPKRRDGARLVRGATILTVEGRARSIFAAERTALNLLGHLSGVATLTRAFVDRVQPLTDVDILDTRKTLPGLRALEKYAVQVGGGVSHRADLAEAVLIKTNHLRAMRHGEFGIRNSEFGMPIQEAVAKAKRLRPKKFVEVEVTNLRELSAALQAKPDAILLDNWSLKDIKKAAFLRYSAFRIPHSALPLLEASGGVTLANVRAIAKTGVDRISIGRLTHSAPAFDVSLHVQG